MFVDGVVTLARVLKVTERRSTVSLHPQTTDFIETDALSVLDVPAELRRDDDVVAERLQGFADELFVGVGAVDLGGVEDVMPISPAERSTRIMSARSPGLGPYPYDIPIQPTPTADTSREATEDTCVHHEPLVVAVGVSASGISRFQVDGSTSSGSGPPRTPRSRPSMEASSAAVSSKLKTSMF